MLVQSARLTLKHHRFEVGSGVIAAVLVGLAALWVGARLVELDIPGRCYPIWLGSVHEMTPECSASILTFQGVINPQAALVLVAMGFLPFAVGLTAGVSVVGRELETRTAQTAWALAASRGRWFARQLWPMLLVLGLAMAFAAAAASFVAASRSAYYFTVLDDLGLHGPLAVARAFVALGLGLITGAALGRALPALIVGAVLSFVLLFGVGVARDAWVHAQQPVELDTWMGNPMFDGIWLDQAWRAADGTLVPEQDAFALMPAEGVDDPYAWLAQRGYEPVVFGVTAETLRQWEPMEIGATVLVGLALMVGTIAIVDRRRPT